MKILAIFGCFGFFVIMLGACRQDTNPAASEIQVDILIRGGQVFSGLEGGTFVQNDVGINDDKIVFVGNANTSGIFGETELAATGKIVTAGFIDPHTHSLDELLSNDKNGNLNYLFQGVTTVFNGNDGDGPVDIAALGAQLTANGIGTNTALYIGHGSLRRHVMGGADRAPTDEELGQMTALVRNAMRAGALGLSSGLFYAPGSFSDTAEVVALAAAAAEFGGIYDTHLRDESSYNLGLLGAVEEAVGIGRDADIPVHIAHIKALGVDVWGSSAAVIELIEAARESGQRVTADQYPWRASGTFLRNALLPKHLLAGDKDAYLRRLHDTKVMADVMNDIRENLRRRGGPESLLIVVSNDANIVGKTLAAVAAERGTEAAETALDIIRRGATRVASFNMDAADIEAFMSRSWVMTSSDGTNGHPRKFASFPQKYSQYVQQREVLSIEDFLYRSATLAADTFGLSDRGRIEVDLVADVIVFDPESFAPLANFDAWDELSTGVVHAIVNGQLAIQDQKPTGALAGKVLLKDKIQ